MYFHATGAKYLLTNRSNHFTFSGMDGVTRMDRQAGEAVHDGRAATAAAWAGGCAGLAVCDNRKTRQTGSPVGEHGAGCDLRIGRRGRRRRGSWCAFAAALALLLGAGAAQAQTDTDPPELIAGTIHQKSVKLYFNEDLDTTGTAPAGSQFELSGTTTTTAGFGTISGVMISGSEITMTTTNASTTTETVTLAISTTTGIQDPAGNALAPVSSFTLTNTAGTDPGKPALSTATVNGDTLTLTYDKTLHPGRVPQTSAFTVAGTATATTVTGVSVPPNGTDVVLTLSTAVTHGESGITVSYSKANAPRTQNMWGTQADALTTQAVTNKTPPAFQSAAVNGATLTVTFDANLKATPAPAGSAFTLSDGKSGTGTASISGATATVTLDAAVAHGATVTVSYAKPASNPLQDAAGNEVVDFAGQAVTNNTPDTPPAFESARVDGDRLAVMFDEHLDGDSAPAGSAFTLSDGKSGTGTADISGATAMVTLDAAVAPGAAVTVSYTKPASDPLQDAAGNAVQNFAGNAVTNTTPRPPAAPVNGAPVADVGADQVVAVGAAVTLDGSGSSDPDGDPLTYAWTQTGGTAVTLDDAGAAQPTFTAPAAPAELVFALTVHDGAAGSAADTVTVTVRAAAPAAPVQLTTTAMDAAVRLRWSMGGDGGSPVLRHEYRQSSDGGGRWSDWRAIPDSAPGEANASGFTVHGLTNGMAYSFRVRAVNVAGAGPGSAPAAPAMPRVNRAPTADAGPDRRVDAGAAVRLDGSGSSDPDGDPLTYAWRQTGGTAVTLDDAAAVRPAFTAPALSGELEFALTVTDPEGAAGSDRVTVRVQTDAALRMQRANERMLPQVLRATAAGTLAVVAERIEQAAAGRMPGGGVLQVAAPFGGRPGVYAVADALPQVADGAAFALPLALAAGGVDDGPEAGQGMLSTLTVWGSGDYRSLGDGPAAGAAGVRWDGALLSAHLGVDLRPAPHVLTGLALSWTQGAFDYTDTTGGGALRGTWNSRLLGLHPYLSWAMPRLGLWVTGGVGWGDVVIDDAAAPAAERESLSALTQMQAAGGGRMTLLEADLLPGGRSSAALKAEASLVQGTLRGNAQLARLTVTALTSRLLLEGRHEQELGGGSRLTPSVEVGVRHDNGTGPIGTGLEVGGALRYGYGGWLTVEGRGRVLLTHSRAALREWGAGGLVLVAPGGGGAEGLALQVRPEWGPVAAGAQQVWAGAAPVGGGERGQPAARLAAEASYGLAVLGAQGLLTPLAGMTLADGAVHSYRLGGRFALGDALQVSLIGERAAAASALTLTGTLRH